MICVTGDMGLQESPEGIWVFHVATEWTRYHPADMHAECLKSLNVSYSQSRLLRGTGTHKITVVCTYEDAVPACMLMVNSS